MGSATTQDARIGGKRKGTTDEHRWTCACYILNTNSGNNEQDHEGMLAKHKAAAYFDPWKFKIELLNKNDVVFLYKSGSGVVAFGEADGKLVHSVTSAGRGGAARNVSRLPEIEQNRFWSVPVAFGTRSTSKLGLINSPQFCLEFAPQTASALFEFTCKGIGSNRRV